MSAPLTSATLGIRNKDQLKILNNDGTLVANIPDGVGDGPVMGPPSPTTAPIGANAPVQQPATLNAPASGSSGSGRPVTGEVTSNQTASGQLASMWDSNSEYMKRFYRKGEQQANNRNLLNSSISARSAVGAAIDAAAPIAINDANTYSRQALENQAAQNTASLESARLAQSNLENIRNNQTSLDTQASQNQNQVLLQNLSDTSRERMETLRLKTELDTNSNTQKTAAYQSMITAIAGYEADPNMSRESKNSAIQQQIDFYEKAVAYQDALLGKSTSNINTITAESNAKRQQDTATREAADKYTTEKAAMDRNNQTFTNAKSQGLTPAQVAAQTGYTEQQVRDWLKATGNSL